MVFRSINEAESMALLSVVKEVISLGLFPLVVKGHYAWAMRRLEGGSWLLWKLAQTQICEELEDLL